MFDFSKQFARRVFISRTHGELTIAIRRRNDHLSQILGIVWSTGVFVMFFLVLLSLRPQVGESTHTLRFLVLAPFALVYCFLTGIGLRRAFGTEEIIVKDGTFHWTRKALYWKRYFQAPQTDVTDIAAKKPWIGFNNHVEFTVKGRTYSIGDSLLHDEALQLALNLQYALKQPPGKSE